MSALSKTIGWFIIKEQAKISLQNKRRFDEFDGLRFLAAFTVIATHYACQTTAISTIRNVPIFPGLQRYSLANLAVVFFFALSGFLLSYLASKEYATTGSINIQQFYFRRCKRIFPLYFVCFFAGFLLTHANFGLFKTWNSPHAWDWSFKNSWLFVSFLSNWPLAIEGVNYYQSLTMSHFRVFWSVAVEIQLYFLVPLLLIFLLKKPENKLKNLSWVLGSALLLKIIFILSTRYFPTKIGGELYYSTFSYIDIFALACFSALFIHEFSLNWLRNRFAGMILIISLLVTGYYWQKYLWQPYVSSYQSTVEWWFQWSVVLLLPFMIGILIMLSMLWLLVNSGSLPSRFLRHPIMIVLGRYSYGIYLWHMQVQYFTNMIDELWVKNLPQRYLAFGVNSLFVIFVLTTIALSGITYFCVEKPFLNMKTPLQRNQNLVSHNPDENLPMKSLIIFSIVGTIILCLILFILATVHVSK